VAFTEDGFYRGGEKISAEEVETLIVAHPAVRESRRLP
jgi:non-ribosomal peptide synthetase component E (peptide arylation enzyme)